MIGLIFGIVAQIMTFFQLQGPLKYEWFKNNYWLVVLMGIPTSMLFMFSVKNMILAYGGQMWPSRLIGFSIGAIVFTYFSWSIFGEPLTMKTIICLMLAVSILMVQLIMRWWKRKMTNGVIIVACHHRDGLCEMWWVRGVVGGMKNKFIFLTNMRRRKPTLSDIFPHFCVDGPRPSVGSNNFIKLSPSLVSS